MKVIKAFHHGTDGIYKWKMFLIPTLPPDGTLTMKHFILISYYLFLTQQWLDDIILWICVKSHRQKLCHSTDILYIESVLKTKTLTSVDEQRRKWEHNI